MRSFFVLVLKVILYTHMKNILLIISGGIAAYKRLELIRLLKKANINVRCILTKGGEQFVTPLSVAALSENHVYTDLWSLKDETEMGHIRLSREADLIVIAPASANMIAKIARGYADDLASTTLLAADTPIMIAPAMNHMMWQNPATQENIQTLKERGIEVLEPTEGAMACNETGIGRMQEPEDIFEAIKKKLALNQPLSGFNALVTSGPTFEPIDPVRFIGNRSSGKQGQAIACALRDAGASVTLITGPVSLPDPDNIQTIHVETAEEMYLAADKHHIGCDIAICAAAPSDWRPKEIQKEKIKKDQNQNAPQIKFEENKDILHMISNSKSRPDLVVGFAAETENLVQNAQNKLDRKGCDWILANDVSNGKVFGGDKTHIHLVTTDYTEDLGSISKAALAKTLINKIAKHIKRS